MINRRRKHIWLAGAFAGCLLAAASARGEFADFRALWVTRFEYSTSSPASVQQIMDNAANLGFTDVLFQVRAQADAYYESNFEPRSERLSGTWDPLQTAIDAAHGNGLKLHAWVNTMPLWRTTDSPVDPSHPFFNTDPSFRRESLDGLLESPTNATAYPINGEYASVNPILPEVHTHINNVVTDIVTNYSVDGVHLDYIRWLGSHAFEALPHDTQSHQMFQTASGLDASNPSNRFAYTDYIESRITDLVGTIKTSIDATESSLGRTIDLSAAVWRDPDVAEAERLQDYRTWLENDLLDIAMPMIYLRESNDNLFLPNLLNTLNIPSTTRVAPGLGVYLHDSENGGVPLTMSQLQRLHDNGADGATIFSYSSLFGSDPLAADRRAAIQQFYEAFAEPGFGGLSPEANLLADFEQDEGSFDLPPTFSGSTTGVDGAAADLTTTEAFLGSGAQEIVIDGSGTQNWLVRHLSGGGSPAENVALPSDGYLGFWLKTESSGITVSPVVDDPGTGERGLAKPLNADGAWHLYEWDLSDDSQWNGWVTGNGSIDNPTVTLDSIQFFGVGDATIYLDAVAHNPLGSLLAPQIPGDFNGDGIVDGADYGVWKSTFGETEDLRADANGDGQVDATDYVIWRDGIRSVAAGSSTTVPEPSTPLLLCLAVGIGVAKRKRFGWAVIPSSGKSPPLH